VADGAQVVFAARRADRLDRAVARAGGGRAVVGDVRLPNDCERIVAEAVAAYGGLDVLVYAAGITPLGRLSDVDADHWRSVFETNVFAPALVTRAALAHLAEGAVAVYLSSDSVGRPRQGLVAYSASKAALDESIRGWRTEHPELRFVRVVVGPTVGTDVARGYDPELFGELLRRWTAEGFMTERQMEAAELAKPIVDAIARCLAHPGIAVEDLCVRPPGPRLVLDPGQAT